MKGNVGILGGSFDPIHRGHLLIAEQAQQKLDLSRVVFMPADHPRLKNGRGITPMHHRIAMVRRAIKNNANLEISTVLADAVASPYGWDTLLALRHQTEPDSSIFFLMGWDALARLSQWEEPDRLVRLC
jgi:nicotinate-nucleotide adenylyltransferase